MRQAQERLGSELESRLSRQTSISALRLPSLAPVLPGCGGICNLRAVGCPPFAHFEGLWEPSCADNGLSNGRRAEDGGPRYGGFQFLLDLLTDQEPDGKWPTIASIRNMLWCNRLLIIDGAQTRSRR